MIYHMPHCRSDGELCQRQRTVLPINAGSPKNCGDRLRLTIAAFTAVAGLAAVHRTVFAGLFASRLIGRERAGADDCSNNRKDNFSVVFHTDLNLAAKFYLRE
jgi:hypothetical protein